MLPFPLLPSQLSAWNPCMVLGTGEVITAILSWKPCIENGRAAKYKESGPLTPWSHVISFLAVGYLTEREINLYFV